MSKYICHLDRLDAVSACLTVDGPVQSKLLLALSKLCMWEAIGRGWKFAACAANFPNHVVMNQIRRDVEEGDVMGGFCTWVSQDLCVVGFIKIASLSQAWPTADVIWCFLFCLFLFASPSHLNSFLSITASVCTVVCGLMRLQPLNMNVQRFQHSLN